MGHGTPDWWGSEPGETTFQVQDVGELAARLGSIDTFDRRGNVVFLESFEEGLSKWTLFHAGTADDILLSTTYPKHGAYSVKLIGGSGVGHYVQIRHREPIPVLSRIGFEFSWAPDSDMSTIEQYLYWYDGTNDYTWAVRYVVSTHALQVRDSAGNWQTITTAWIPSLTYSTSHVWKLVVDLETGEYAFLIVDQNGYDLSAYSGQFLSAGLGPYLSMDLFYYSTAGKNSVCYIDDVIITQNEP